MVTRPRTTQSAGDPPRPARTARPPWTLLFFAVFALCLWLNVIVNHYRFNLVAALVGSIPLLIVAVARLTPRRAAPVS